MTRPNLHTALRALAPRAAWSISQDGAIVAWEGNGDAQPDAAAIVAELARQVADWDALQWRRNREAAYPSVQQLTVALWEQLVEGRPESVQVLQEIRTAVKDANPKPPVQA